MNNRNLDAKIIEMKLAHDRALSVDITNQCRDELASAGQDFDRLKQLAATMVTNAQSIRDEQRDQFQEIEQTCLQRITDLFAVQIKQSSEELLASNPISAAKLNELKEAYHEIFIIFQQLLAVASKRAKASNNDTELMQLFLKYTACVEQYCNSYAALRERDVDSAAFKSLLRKVRSDAVIQTSALLAGKNISQIEAVDVINRVLPYMYLNMILTMCLLNPRYEPEQAKTHIDIILQAVSDYENHYAKSPLAKQVYAEQFAKVAVVKSQMAMIANYTAPIRLMHILPSYQKAKTDNNQNDVLLRCNELLSCLSQMDGNQVAAAAVTVAELYADIGRANEQLRRTFKAMAAYKSAIQQGCKSSDVYNRLIGLLTQELARTTDYTCRHYINEEIRIFSTKLAVMRQAATALARAEEGAPASVATGGMFATSTTTAVASTSSTAATASTSIAATLGKRGRDQQ